MHQLLSIYLPMDRRQALARGATLPEHPWGAALFADISGFTPLAQTLAAQLGPQRAAEELTFHLNRVYDALIAQVHAHGGSVIGFVGDAITCWFEDQDKAAASLSAVACALAMQAAMAPFAAIAVAPGVSVSLHIKIGVAAGPARRFCVGDPDIQRIDVLAGQPLRWMAQAEGQARKGEILVDESALAGAAFSISEQRLHPETGRRLALVTDLLIPALARSWSSLPAQPLSPAQLRSWVLPPLYAGLARGDGERLPELRPATALFLRFSGLDYDTDPQAGAKLDSYIRWVQQIVTWYGGNVIQLTIGDKGSFLYAAFGAPIAHGDDARRAVQAALALQAPPATLGFAPDAQIGLASGSARTGAYGSAARRSYGVIGDDVVLAARLMTVAPPGEIRCAHSIFAQTQSHIAFEHLPPARVKGRVELVRVYRPLAESRVSLAPAAALVGRQAERGRLRAALSALQTGDTCVLLLEGEAGIGKSRLVEELKRLAGERGLTGLLGAGQSIEQHTPFRAWRDIFTAYFALEDLHDPVMRQRRVIAVVSQAAPTQLERLALLNTLLDLDLPETPLTAALPPELRQQALRRLLVVLLEAWSRAQPLVLVLEDAHWLDTLSWKLAEEVALTFSVRQAPLLLVLAHRRLELGEAGNVSLGRLRALPFCQTLPLTGLAPHEIVELVAWRLGVTVETLPPALATLVQTRADGNPFFAEELLSALCERGSIETRLDAAQPLVVTGDLEQEARTLPATLHGLILARIDRLPPLQQAVLKAAAVLGRSFSSPLLLAAFNQWHEPLTPEALHAELAALNQGDFTFVEIADPEVVYFFKHIITQEAAYHTLLFAQRRELHTLVAAWYAVQPALSGYLPLLVHHYHQAELPEPEQHYARLAGEQAAHYYDNENALRYFSRALELAPPDDWDARYTLLLAREAVYDVLGEREVQAADIAALDALAARQNAPVQRAAVALRRSRYAAAVDDYPAALQAAQAGVALARQCGDVLLETQGLHAWGRILRQQGDFVASRERLEQALALAQQSEQPQEQARSLYDLGTTRYQAGDYVGAQECYAQAHALYAQLDYKQGLVQCALMFGALYYQMGDYIAEREQYRLALTESQAIGWRYGEGFALTSLGNNAFELGDYRAAQTYQEQALRMGREIGHREGVALSLDTLGLIHTMQGDYAVALKLGQEALRIQREIADTYSLGYTLNHVGLAWLGMGELAAAAAAFTEALQLRRDLEQEAAALDDLAGLARVALAQGAVMLARTYAEEILAHLEPELPEGVEFPALVYLTSYQTLHAAGDVARAAEVLAMGRSFLAARAAAIHEPELRAQFLQQVPFNRQLAAELP